MCKLLEKIRNLNENEKTEWILRIGIFGMFLGHGVFAILIKQSWIHYITAVGFSDAAAESLLFLIGIIDIIVAIFALVHPIKLVLIWATLWSFATALIRPISGEPIWDFVERSANWAAPLALLSLQGFPKKLKDLFEE